MRKLKSDKHFTDTLIGYFDDVLHAKVSLLIIASFLNFRITLSSLTLLILSRIFIIEHGRTLEQTSEKDSWRRSRSRKSVACPSYYRLAFC